MKKILFVLCMVPMVAVAAWPIGNIGLDVDKPMALLDVGKNAIIRGTLLFPPSGTDDECIGGLYENLDMSKPGIYFGINSCDGGASITLEDDGDDYLWFRSGNSPLFDNWAGAIRIHNSSRDKTYSIGQDVRSFSNCSGVNVVNSLDYDQGDAILVQMNYGDNPDASGETCFQGSTLKLNGNWDTTPVKIMIQTVSYGLEGTLKVVVGNNNEEWFTISCMDCMYIEIMYLPGFANEKGRFQYVRGIDGYDCVELSPRFSNDDAGRIPVNGGGF